MPPEAQFISDGIADFACGEVLEDGTICPYSCSSIRPLATHRIHATKHTGKFIGAIVVANQCPYCSTDFASIEAARWHVNNAFTTGACKCNKSNRPNPLAIPSDIVCPFCSEGFVNLAAYY